MAFQKIEEEVWTPEKEGDEITGILFKTEEDVGDFHSKLYHIETEAGKQLAVWGSIILDGHMNFVNLGDKIKIIFRGTKKSDTKGKQPTKLFEVYKDVPESTEDPF